jgi:hypothetical protein
MFSTTSISALAYFSSYVLKSFSSPFALLSFLGSARRIRAHPQLLAATAALYALRS